jgi:hypothetical protein
MSGKCSCGSGIDPLYHGKQFMIREWNDASLDESFTTFRKNAMTTSSKLKVLLESHWAGERLRHSTECSNFVKMGSQFKWVAFSQHGIGFKPRKFGLGIIMDALSLQSVSPICKSNIYCQV